MSSGLRVVRRNARLLISALLLPHHVKPYQEYGGDDGQRDENPEPEEAAAGGRRARHHVAAAAAGWSDDPRDLSGVDALDGVFQHEAVAAGANEPPVSVAALLLALAHRTFVDVVAKAVAQNKAVGTRRARMPRAAFTDRGAFLL